jgi:hypothetical protein
VSPVAIVWPCPLAVDAYAAAGRDLGFPRPDCPSCAGPLVFWPGYRRYVREAGRYWKIFVPRLRCARCGVSHALLTAIGAAFAAAASLPGWGRLGAWRFASAVTGGKLIAANTVWYVVGRRRLMPPIPP